MRLGAQSRGQQLRERTFGRSGRHQVDLDALEVLMPCSSFPHSLCRAWPNSVVHGSNGLRCSWQRSATAVPETYGPTSGASATGGARDCRRSDGRAAVMQVRPLSVSSGTAGSNPFGRPTFGDPGWL